jgi:HSP20 family protein
MWKPQFLKKLTEDSYIEEYDDDVFEDDYHAHDDVQQPAMGQHISLREDTHDENEHTINAAPLTDPNEPVMSELSVDVYQTPDEIVVRTMVAGVPPHNVDISLTRDMLTITGSREEEKEVTEGDYFHRELSWGSFTRTVMLPAEVEVDEADAQEKHGILTIRLPKINKERQAKIKVKSR